ncbi:uncharacterized protein LOC120113692 [Hibiscus syriacus]|uniref:uncharacterized protein LOC120113692 n=1 Tax=Hibiscus syriacus TaxID=106335 RepID=UPI00192458E5|nr:uncharacterized protein LOC120113692 [Hibiscus syriacus]
MFYPFLCGAFHHQEEEEEEEGNGIWSTSPARSPRKSKRKKDTKNPYSTRGLDQFSALLAELEEKRQKIYSQTGSQSLVRFVYNKSNDCVPVVINLQDNNNPIMVKTKVQTPSESDKNIDVKSKKRKKKRFSWKNLRKPSYYIPVIVILILLFLMFVGRSVAILCTCVGWYIVPTINGEGSNMRRSMKKKDYVRRESGNKLISGKLSFSKG